MLSPSLVALLKRVSRSFYLSVRVLPPSVQAQVAVGYLLARAADTIADTPLLPNQARAEMLAELRQAVAGQNPAPLLQRLGKLLPPENQAQSQTARAERELLLVVGECLAVLRTLLPADQRLIEHVLDQLAHGMTVDLQRFPAADSVVAPARVVALTSLSDLDEYTYYAAGCVGEFWTDLMAQHIAGMERLAAPELRQRGVALGKALQLVNVLRDAAADLRAGRCYWPTEMLQAHGLTPVALATLAAAGAPPPAPGEAVALRRVTAELSTLILRAAESAWPYVQAIAARAVRLRLACAWPLLLALETLTALHQAGSPILAPGRPVKVTRGQVYALIARSTYAPLRDLRGGGRLDRLFDMKDRGRRRDQRNRALRWIVFPARRVCRASKRDRRGRRAEQKRLAEEKEDAVKQRETALAEKVYGDRDPAGVFHTSRPPKIEKKGEQAEEQTDRLFYGPWNRLSAAEIDQLRTTYAMNYDRNSESIQPYYVIEEINRLTSFATAPNYGWPCFEGVNQQPAYANSGFDLCQSLYAQGGDVKPYFTYVHGAPIGPNDLLIAAHALSLDCILVTDNQREFARVPDLRIENWLRTG